MQIDTSHNVQVSTNLPPAQGTMSLDSEGMAHLIQVLTNLYSDKYLAVLREYSTNARDSHVQANLAHLPIEVTLPTTFNPTLIVSDHGVGLSREELLGIYSRYGASTKRDTNTQVGSFGLGSKSAFTIGGQFVVTARKDHHQTSAVFAMNAHGVGTVSILAEHETSEANGVTVSIAVSDPAAMQEAASKFFLAWPQGTVLVDGQPPESYYSDPNALWLSDDILYTRRGGITVSMGSVAYPLPDSAVYAVRNRTGLRFPTYNAGLLVTLPIGSVDITPSREGIRDTERSLQAVSDVLKSLPEHLTARLSEAQQSAPDQISSIFACRRLLSAAEHLNVSTSSSLPAQIQLPPQAATLYGTTSRGGLRTEDLSTISAQTAHLITVLTGVPAKRSAKRHAKAWLKENSSRRMLVSFADAEAVQGQIAWFRYGNGSPVETVHFDDIELPVSERTASERAAITYSVHTPDGSHHLYTPSEIKSQPLPVAYGMSGPLQGYLTVSLSNRQSLEAFLRRVPSAVPAGPIMQAAKEARLTQLGDLSELQLGYWSSRALSNLSYKLGRNNTDKITHPAYLAAHTAAARFNALPSADQQLVRSAPSALSEEQATAELHAKLPLLMFMSSTYGTMPPAAVKHLIAYANSQPA